LKINEINVKRRIVKGLKTTFLMVKNDFEDVNLAIPELASLVGVTDRSIERIVKKLQEQGRLRRVGPARGATGR